MKFNGELEEPEEDEKDFLKSAVIKEMNPKDQLIKSTAIAFDQDQDQISLDLDQNTAYVVVEESLTDSSGKPIMKRYLYDCDALKNADSNHAPLQHSFYQTNQDNHIQVVSLELYMQS